MASGETRTGWEEGENVALQTKTGTLLVTFRPEKKWINRPTLEATFIVSPDGKTDPAAIYVNLTKETLHIDTYVQNAGSLATLHGPTNFSTDSRHPAFMYAAFPHLRSGELAQDKLHGQTDFGAMHCNKGQYLQMDLSQWNMRIPSSEIPDPKIIGAPAQRAWENKMHMSPGCLMSHTGFFDKAVEKQLWGEATNAVVMELAALVAAIQKHKALSAPGKRSLNAILERLHVGEQLQGFLDRTHPRVADHAPGGRTG